MPRLALRLGTDPGRNGLLAGGPAQALRLGDRHGLGRWRLAAGAQPVDTGADQPRPDGHGPHPAHRLQGTDEAERRRDLGILRQPVVVEHVAAGHHVHHVEAVHPRRVVQQGVVEAAILQLGDLGLAVRQHLLARAEADRPRGARLHARRLEAPGHPVDAHRALVDLLGGLIEAGDVEGAARHAVLAPDALGLVEVDDAVLVLHDRPGSRAGQQAAGLVAVHAAVLADQPGEIAVVEVDLLEPHEVPGGGGQVLVALVAAEVEGLVGLEVVPLLAGDLAGLAADAQVDVDQLRHLGALAPDVGAGGG